MPLHKAIEPRTGGSLKGRSSQKSVASTWSPDYKVVVPEGLSRSNTANSVRVVRPTTTNRRPATRPSAQVKVDDVFCGKILDSLEVSLSQRLIGVPLQRLLLRIAAVTLSVSLYYGPPSRGKTQGGIALAECLNLPINKERFHPRTSPWEAAGYRNSLTGRFEPGTAIGEGLNLHDEVASAPKDVLKALAPIYDERVMRCSNGEMPVPDNALFVLTANTKVEGERELPVSILDRIAYAYTPPEVSADTMDAVLDKMGRPKGTAQSVSTLSNWFVVDNFPNVQSHFQATSDWISPEAKQLATAIVIVLQSYREGNPYGRPEFFSAKSQFTSRAGNAVRRGFRAWDLVEANKAPGQRWSLLQQWEVLVDLVFAHRLKWTIDYNGLSADEKSDIRQQLLREACALARRRLTNNYRNTTGLKLNHYIFTPKTKVLLEVFPS